MEALAQGYGSDSSNSSTSSKEDDNDSNKNSDTLHLLASNYSDDSNDGQKDGSNSNDNRSSNNSHSLTKKYLASNNLPSPPSKKQRQHDANTIPPPRISNPTTDNSFDALALFPKDYISQKMEQFQIQSQTMQDLGDDIKEEKTSNKIILSTKLNNMYHKFYTDGGNGNASKTSFAKHLKSQKEYGNPHLFPSIISHFGIDPLGTNSIMAGSKNTSNGIASTPASGNKPMFAKFEYVEKIMQKEEENRIRQYTNSTIQ